MQSAQRLKVLSRSHIANALLLLLSIGVVAAAYQIVQRRMTSVISMDAVVNGTLVEIKAPQEGVVTRMQAKTGDALQESQPLVAIENQRISKLQFAEISSTLIQQRAQLAQAEAMLAQQLTLLETVSADKQNQRPLEVAVAQRSIDEATAELRGVQAEYRLAERQQQRTATLVAEGALPQADLDEVNSEREQQQAEMGRLQARISALHNNLKAAQLGLTIDRSRSSYDPATRRQELQMQINSQRQAVLALRQSIIAAEAQLAEARADVQREQQIQVSAPVTGLIWRLTAQPNQFVEQGESLGQMLNCQQRWVDVYVDETAVRSLQPGTPATVRLYGADNRELQGRVSLVRSGTGRLQAGEDVAMPIPPNTPRTSQVRVELDPNADLGSPQLFCYVGYTGRVTFHVR